jgi:hypothetical protein
MFSPFLLYQYIISIFKEQNIVESLEFYRYSMNIDSSASTWYYVTFQVESGDRMELAVRGSDYGMLAEGGV